MPITRSRKGSISDVTDRRLNPVVQETGGKDDPSGALKVTTQGASGSVQATGTSGVTTKAPIQKSVRITVPITAAITSEGASTDSEAMAATSCASTETAAAAAETVKPKHVKPRDAQKFKNKLKLQVELAELKLKEIQASLALAQARLERQRAAEEEDDSSDSEDEEVRSNRVEEWLEGQSKDPTKKPDEENKEGRGQGAHMEQECEHRDKDEGSRPARQPQNVDVTSLATALTQAFKMTRDAPKYLQELPAFNGQSNSWLAFRAAYYETEALFSRTENVSRLRRSVRGAAWEAISSLWIGQPEPATIMEALERRFGRPDALAMCEAQKLKALGKLNDNPRDLCIFANKFANIVATIEALKKVNYLYNPELVKITIEKLTPILRSKWYDYAALNKEDIPDVKRLAAFLNSEADKCGAYAPPEEVPASSTQEKRFKKSYERTFLTNTSAEQCPMCKQEHQLPECKLFRDASVKERWEIAKKHRLCFRCLRDTHRRGMCRARLCGLDGCAMAHHRFLHKKMGRTPSPTPHPAAQEEVVSIAEVVRNTSTVESCRAFLKIAPVILTGQHGVKIHTYALLDDGSTITLIDEGLAEMLNLDGPRDEICVQGLNDTMRYANSRRVKVKIQGKYNSDEYVIRNARTVQHLMFTKQNVETRDLQGCTHLRGLEERLTYHNACPRVLIGQDNWELLMAIELRIGKRYQPVASHTRLGWVLHGCRTSYERTVAFCGHTVTKEETMENLMKKFFELEALGVEPKKLKNDPDERALKMLEEKSYRLPDGRFETGLLWKRDNQDIPDNYKDAYKRLITLERRLDRNPDLKIKYTERINHFLNSRYAVPAAAPAQPGRTWYLPHFAVCNPLKPKIRVVHDAAARSHGVSLNDMLLSGPDLLQSLPGVIMRFRQHRYALSADIKEMFMQIRIREEDRDALRFLWRGDERGDTKPREYQMTSVIFGATSSPCTALYIKNRNADEFKDAFPKAVKEIRYNHYMDDYITSFATKEEAIETSRNVDYIHRQAGFVLRGWVSNEQSIVSGFDADRETTMVPIGGTDIEKTLGLLWEVKEDYIGFHFNENRTPPEVYRNERPPTKREALSIIMSLFDPLGLVSPITTPAKRLMQETWRFGTGWDEPIPEELQSRWCAWINNLRGIRTLQIPRCYNIGLPIIERELHTFVDASEEAYSAAVYIRMKHSDGSINIVLAAAKSRVAPLKPISIPRLELQAALLGTRLARTVIEGHDFTFMNKTYWSDSRTVLAWIRAEPRTFKTFVAHRLAEIEETTKVKEWRWTPSGANVADDTTRNTPPDFDAQHRWFRGPDFLRRSETEWPKEEKVPRELTGEEKCFVTIEPKVCAYLPDIKRIAKWQVLIRASGRVLQFLDLCKCKKCVTVALRRKRTKCNQEKDPVWDNKKKGPSGQVAAPIEKGRVKYISLDASYLKRAEQLWIKKVQDDSYASERARIAQGGAPSPRDRLASLQVQVDSDGVLRLRGRIRAARDVHSETIDPALLDGQHRYTKMYIQYVHEKMLHGGVETVVNEIRQRFWVTRIRPTVKGVIMACPRCRLVKAKPASPATGDLPPARLAHNTRPFSFTGVDYFGPLEVTVGRHREKRWVALFTCLTVRAVHLEVVASLSADSAIAALRRFVARRGQPTELWSDNATCFRAADKELRAAWEATRDEANARHINWRYIPPGAPFMGGAWERLIRSVKEALRVILREKYPSDETLNTLLVETENIVNSRPLTHVAVTPDEPEALTPNHILLGPNNHVAAPGSFTEEDRTARRQWRRAQRLADEFWRRWLKEYLPALQHRREPRTTGQPPRVGDLVIVCDPNLPRNVWPKGRVTQIYPGKDNEVRVVDITTSNGHILRRPSRKIVVLPVGSQAATAGEMCTTE